MSANLSWKQTVRFVLLGAAVWVLAGLPAAANGALDQIWDLEEVNADGTGAHPALALPPEDPDAWVTFQGVVLNRPHDLISDPQMEWQIYVQAFPDSAAPYDKGGIACYANHWYDFMKDPVPVWPRYPSDLAPGDIVEVTGVLGFYNGKTNLNERHDSDYAFTVAKIGETAVPGPWDVASIAACNYFDTEDLDGDGHPDRNRGGERYQSQWCRLRGVRIVEGTWGNGEVLTLADDSGGTLTMKLGIQGDFDSYGPPARTFNVVGVFDQEDTTGSPYHDGYRIRPLWFENIEIWGDTDRDGDVDATDLATFGMNWAPSAADKQWALGDFDADGDVDATDLAALGMNWSPSGGGVPEPAALSLLAAGVLGVLIRRRRGPWKMGSMFLTAATLPFIVGCANHTPMKEAAMGETAPLPDKPFVLSWKGDEFYIPLLKGVPMTCGMRSGRVALKRGEECGRHSTGAHEETLVVLEGRGEATAEGHGPIQIEAGQTLYVPPHTVHNVRNDQCPMLRYIYVVAPIRVAETEEGHSHEH